MTDQDSKHPMQPLIKDKEGVIRFKKNAIIDWMFQSGKLDLNEIAVLPFSDEDRTQLAQLLGYSICGFSDLSYVSDDDFEAAEIEYLFDQDGACPTDAEDE